MHRQFLTVSQDVSLALFFFMKNQFSSAMTTLSMVSNVRLPPWPSRTQRSAQANLRALPSPVRYGLRKRVDERIPRFFWSVCCGMPSCAAADYWVVRFFNGTCSSASFSCAELHDASCEDRCPRCRPPCGAGMLATPATLVLWSMQRPSQLL